jgi:GNAT superfamily N-acetyltransferase
LSQPEISIKKVENDYEKNQFIKFPWKIYENDAYWVPPLLFDVKNNLDKKKNPFYDHSKMEMWLAEKEGKLAGRIAAIVNENHNKYYNDKVGFFGFFECVNDKDVSKLLFDTASEYLKENEMEVIRGPVNPSTNDECALLIDGFDSSPVMLMPYNPKYYVSLIEEYGFEKAKDLYALYIGADVINNEELMKRLKRISDMIIKKEKLTLRKVNLSDFNNEVQRIREVYNNAWQENWGFVPMTEDEFKHVAKNLKPIADEDFILFAEKDGKPIGFSLCLPDINQVLKDLNGRLFPFGIFKFLKNKKKIDVLRVIIMGVNVEYHRKGIDAIFYQHIIKTGYKRNIKAGEISWVLEDNYAMVQAAEKLGAHIYKTYRIFDKKLG